MKNNSIMDTFKKNKWNILFVFISFIGLLIYILMLEDIKNIKNQLINVNYNFIMISIFCMFLYFLIESICLNIFSKKFYTTQNFFDSVKASMIGQFFNSVTPFSSGGQPIQAYYMVKTGLTLGDSIYILLSKFIIFQFSLTFLSGILLISQLSYFSNNIKGFSFLVFLGFFINLLVIIALLTFAISTKFPKKVISFILNILYKIKVIKDKEEKLKYFYNEIDLLSNNFKDITKNKVKIIVTFILTTLQLIIYYLIPYFIYRSFGLNEHGMIVFIAAQSFVQLITAFVPLPGGSGGAETSFLAFFGILFSKTYLNLGMLMWRLITYYLNIIISSAFLGYIFLDKDKEANVAEK